MVKTIVRSEFFRMREKSLTDQEETPVASFRKTTYSSATVSWDSCFPPPKTVKHENVIVTNAVYDSIASQEDLSDVVTLDLRNDTRRQGHLSCGALPFFAD